MAMKKRVSKEKLKCAEWDVLRRGKLYGGSRRTGQRREKTEVKGRGSRMQVEGGRRGTIAVRDSVDMPRA